MIRRTSIAFSNGPPGSDQNSFAVIDLVLDDLGCPTGEGLETGKAMIRFLCEKCFVSHDSSYHNIASLIVSLSYMFHGRESVFCVILNKLPHSREKVKKEMHMGSGPV